MVSKHQKYYFQVSGFWWRTCKTNSKFKSGQEIDLEVNWSEETPLYGHNGVARFGLQAPVGSQYITINTFL